MGPNVVFSSVCANPLLHHHGYAHSLFNGPPDPFVDPRNVPPTPSVQERSLLEQAIKLFPTFGKHYLMLAQLEERVGNVEAARVVLRWGGGKKLGRCCGACEGWWLAYGLACSKKHGLQLCSSAQCLCGLTLEVSSVTHTSLCPMENCCIPRMQCLTPRCGSLAK